MWEPIATAPKDGTPVLLGQVLHGIDDGYQQLDAESAHTLCVGFYSQQGWLTFCCKPDSCPVFMIPTHWLPIPKVTMTAESL